MGKVRPERVKKIAKEMVKRYPEKFTADFESNKKLLDSITKMPSPRLRNRIAGYITRLVAIKKAAESQETEATDSGEGARQEETE